jgi:Sec-independent protein translocase protein TatA
MKELASSSGTLIGGFRRLMASKHELNESANVELSETHQTEL